MDTCFGHLGHKGKDERMNGCLLVEMCCDRHKRQRDKGRDKNA